MRTTVRIDDDLLRRLKDQAQREDTSLTRLLNRTLRRGLAAGDNEVRRSRKFREKTFAMGAPRLDLDKALTLAAALEDEDVSQKLARGK